MDKEKLRARLAVSEVDLLEQMVYAAYLMDRTRMKRWVYKEKSLIEQIYTKAASFHDSKIDIIQILDDIGFVSESLQKRFGLSSEEALAEILRLPRNSIYNLGDTLDRCDTSIIDAVHMLANNPRQMAGALLDSEGFPLWCMSQKRGRIVYQPTGREQGQDVAYIPIEDLFRSEWPDAEPEDLDPLCEEVDNFLQYVDELQEEVD